MGLFCEAQVDISYDVPLEYQTLVTYVVEKSINFSLPDETNLQDLPSSDLIQLRPKKERNRVEKYLLADGTVTTIITHLDSENIYPSWYKPSSVTVIDKDKVYKYDESGSLMMEQKHEPLYRVMYKLSTLNTLPENFGLIQKPTYLSSAEISSLEIEGNTIFSDTDGMITITKPLAVSEFTPPNTERQIKYHPENDVIEERRIENGDIKRKSYQFNHYNDDEDYVPNKRVTLTNETTASGFCYEKVEFETYRKYEIRRSIRERNQNGNAISDRKVNKYIEITPNPFNDRFQAKYEAWYYMQLAWELNQLEFLHEYTVVCDDINAAYADFFDDDELAIAEDACTSEIDDIKEVRRAWQKGRDWWLTANERFRIAIGAVEITPALSTQGCTCEVYNNGNFQFTFPTNGSEIGQCDNPDIGSGYTVSCYPTFVYTNVRDN